MKSSENKGLENVNKLKAAIKGCTNEHEAKVMIDSFHEKVSGDSRRGFLESDTLDDKLKEIFNKLDASSSVEAAARERIAYYSSTFRVERGARMCTWIRSEYENLGYNTMLVMKARSEVKVRKLEKGEERVAKGIHKSEGGRLF